MKKWLIKDKLFREDDIDHVVSAETEEQARHLAEDDYLEGHLAISSCTHGYDSSGRLVAAVMPMRY